VLGAVTSDEWLAHNSPFESAILKRYFGYTQPNPIHTHDSQYDIFLADPYAPSFGLKPSAHRILGLPPDEQDAVKDWVLQNVPEAKASDWGAYICRAPGDLVGKYACGDTDRTYALHTHLHPKIIEMGMEDAYQREQLLMPVLMESSERGMLVDVERLARDAEVYEAARKISEQYIFSRLGEFELSKDAVLAEKLEQAGLVTEWVLTATGKRSTSRKNLQGRVKDPELLEHLAYHGVLTTCLSTFVYPWLRQAAAEGGRLHPQWNQIRGDRGDGGDISGTRTGRMSCRDPNLQNVPNDFEHLIIPAIIKTFFDEHFPGMPYVIHMRMYLIAGRGRIWLKRDFSAQEMRILAHFAEGKLYEAYRANPDVDPHKMVQDMLKDMLGIDLPRKFLKIIAFGIMYGRGVPNLSAALGVSEIEGKEFRDAYYSVLPEVRELGGVTRRRGTSGGFIRTWGGRVYFREPNHERDLSYKLLNYLIQGSAADQTKESIVDWHYNHRKPTDELQAAVHDENNITAPEEDSDPAMKRLREAMDADRFDVPFRSEGFAGQNWSEIERYEPA
jgi:DNA polymerase-1